MKAQTLRSFLAVHSWVGMMAGLMLFIAFYAGALTVFHHELEDWAAAGTPAAQATATLDDAQRLLDAALAREPGMAADLRLQLPHEGHDLEVSGADSRTKVWHRFELGADGGLQTHVEHSALGEFVYRLHYTAGLPTPWGTYLMGVVCLLYGLALVSGVLLYLPVLARDLFALRAGKNLKRLWQDAHNAVGLLSLPFHVIFAWSGAVLTIGTLLLAPFQYLVYEGRLLELIGPQAGFSRPVQASGQAAPLLSVRELVVAAQAAAPGLAVERLHIRLAGDANARVEADGVLPSGHLSQATRIELNGATGTVLDVQTPERYTVGTAMLRGLVSLHYADFGGDLLRWLYFLLALGGAFLFYSGNLLWIESRRKHQQAQQLQRASVMARLTLGVSLGCVAGISALFVATRLLGEAGFAPWLERGYFAVFGLCLLWAFVRPVPSAARELAGFAALLTGAIAVVDVAVLGGRALTPVNLGVDLVALAFAAVLITAALASSRRARQGPAHSLWAA